MLLEALASMDTLAFLANSSSKPAHPDRDVTLSDKHTDSAFFEQSSHSKLQT
jgi:hypothetical protein